MSSSARYFIGQLRERLVQSAASARRAEADAGEASRSVATESEKREDARVAVEFGSLAKAQALRGAKLREELQALDALLERGLRPFSADTPVGLGAIVDVATEDEQGAYERTFIVLPVGAGTELEGPGGDGFLTVITPVSPVGKALMSRRVGDVVDVTVKGEPYEWEILGVS